MITKDLKEIYKITAQLTGHPLYKVEHAIKEGQFKFLKDWVHNIEKPAVYFVEFGRFEPYLSALTNALKHKWLPILRYKKSESAIEKFRKLWKIRKKVLEFILSRRRKKRTNWYYERRKSNNERKARGRAKPRDKKTNGFSNADV